ncbi:MAG: CotH kinase family protein [Clostridia bacterium]|nr:CotH kinase family protein [Clostridia bacterium]
MKPIRNKKTFSLLCALLALCLLFGACSGQTLPGDTTEQLTEPPTEEKTTEIYVPTEDYPTADDLSTEADYTKLIISSVYAGSTSKSAPVARSYVCLYNTGKVDLPLQGLAVYVCGGDYVWREYPLSYGASIPAGGYYLILGQETQTQIATPVLQTEHADAIRPNMLLVGNDLRLVIAPVGTQLKNNEPIAGQIGVIDYLSSHTLDSSAARHYVEGASKDELIRRDADSPYAPFDTVDLTKASLALLRQIRPQTSEGDVNTKVCSIAKEVVFSHASGFYNEEFSLSMTAPEGYTVYYTINGADPRTTLAEKYEQPIPMTDTTQMAWGELTQNAVLAMGNAYSPNVLSQMGAWTVRAYATNGKDTTPVTTQTYFVGENIRADELDVFCLAVQPEDFISTNPDGKNIYMNYSDGHARIQAYLEYFTEDSCEFSSWVEIALNGKGSLGMTEKSFRILFRENANPEVSENLNAFNYNIFGEYATPSASGDDTIYYRRLLLRNGGGDNSGCTISRSHIGDAYIARLDSLLHAETMAYKPVFVFINGEFWGIYNARERFDEKYFETVYGVPEEDLAVLECPYPLPYVKFEYLLTHGEQKDVDEFNALFKYAQQNDLSDPEHYKYVCDRVDTDNLIDYFCAQIYLNCSDWPNNNVKVWRNSNPNSISGQDTKWRFCVVDTDHGVGLNSFVDTNLLGTVGDGSCIGMLINGLMGNPEFRERFLMRYIWVTEVYYAPEASSPILEEIVDTVSPVMQLQLDRWKCTDGTPTPYDGARPSWMYYINVIRDYMVRRPAVAKEQLKAHYRLSEDEYQRLLDKAIAEWGNQSPLLK